MAESGPQINHLTAGWGFGERHDGLVAHGHRRGRADDFLCMGLGAFMWGALSDRYGTRAVVLSGGALLGLGMVLASQATTLLQFQLRYGAIVGVDTGSFYAPLISTTTRWFTQNRSLAVALVSAGLSVGSTVMAPLARWLITSYDWRPRCGSSAISCGS